jgi:hypothetical protein
VNRELRTWTIRPRDVGWVKPGWAVTDSDGSHWRVLKAEGTKLTVVEIPPWWKRLWYWWQAAR